MFVGHGLAVGFGVAAGRGVFVGSGVEVGNGVFVGRGVAVGIGPGIEVEVVKVSATFASTVASIAVSASRVPLTPASTVASRLCLTGAVTPASTVAGTSAVGRDSVCWSGVDVASLEQATAVRPEITKTIRIIILIFFPHSFPSTQSTAESEGSGSEGSDRWPWTVPPQVGLGNCYLAVD